MNRPYPAIRRDDAKVLYICFVLFVFVCLCPLLTVKIMFYIGTYILYVHINIRIFYVFQLNCNNVLKDFTMW